ncbi:ectonucleotide pyrophosphatase/phosphodiesterase [Collimonas fungivorans]|uniref:alkaline phosphatase family protein n=1 Tax=Collimonas fungivorans TaxID=158899 RepID=UPI000778272B|nr:ectonucleotide pyrophosphatase/phosphodiesterase [Collimonas fungivorans]
MKNLIPYPALRGLLCILLPAIAAGCAPATLQPPEQDARAPLILVSIDGFKPDYLTRGVTPNLNALAAQGARAEAMRPSFPSITFPNHYTLVTGLRPDRHGIVGNTMGDSEIPGVRFSLGNRQATNDRRWWDEAEPIWVTAEQHGVRSATMFWPGSEAAIHGVRPSEWRSYDSKLPANQRVDTLLGWLDKPVASRPAFLTLYFEDVDHAGHEYGPDAAQTTQAAAHVDEALGRLVAGLQTRDIKANIVIVSDHGMAAMSRQRVIRLDQIAPPGSYRTVTSGTYAGLEAAPGQDGVLAAALLKPQEHMQCWRKEAIPPRFHYGQNPRVPGFICLAEVGWQIASDARSAERTPAGGHGYDNLAVEMQAIFIAAGPAFKPGIVLPPFDNVDVYPLMMNLIGLQPLPSDGEMTLAPALN